VQLWTVDGSSDCRDTKIAVVNFETGVPWTQERKNNTDTNLLTYGV